MKMRNIAKINLTIEITKLFIKVAAEYFFCKKHANPYFYKIQIDSDGQTYIKKWDCDACDEEEMMILINRIRGVKNQVCCGVPPMVVIFKTKIDIFDFDIKISFLKELIKHLLVKIEKISHGFFRDEIKNGR